MDVVGLPQEVILGCVDGGTGVCCMLYVVCMSPILGCVYVAPYFNMTFDGIAGHRRLYFAVLRPLMSPFCGVTATDAFILLCYGH